jgi:16S rRNA (guanine(966)-N(2))-methyltransferase RsmD
MVAKRRRRVRVMAGEFKGRLLEYPWQGSTRPTMQRTKSSVFESLGHSLENSVFVDLYAAAGGMGIEAISRGARFACFVENDPRAVEFIHRNLELCGVDKGRYRVHARDVTSFLEDGSLSAINPDIVYIDPPYGETDFRVLLELSSKIAYPARVTVIVEHPTAVTLGAGALVRTQVRSFGQTSVSFFALGK